MLTTSSDLNIVNFEQQLNNQPSVDSKMNNQVIDDQLTAFNMEDDIVKCCDPTVVGCLTSRKRNNVLPIKTRRKRVRSVAKVCLH